MNVLRNKISKPINIPSMKSEQLKAESAFIPTMSLFPPNVWVERKNTLGAVWEKNYKIRSKDMAKSVQNKWKSEKDLVDLENKLQTELEQIIPLLPNDWYTKFEQPDNSGCNSMYPSDDENDNDSSILDIY